MSAAHGLAATPDGRTQLHWQSTGRGAPVLLIMGLGLSGGAWWRTVPVLARRLRVITFDHRGVGRSRAFSDVYTSEALLRSLGWTHFGGVPGLRCWRKP